MYKILAWLLCLALLSAPGGTCFADGCYDSCTCENCCAAAPAGRRGPFLCKRSAAHPGNRALLFSRTASGGRRTGGAACRI